MKMRLFGWAVWLAVISIPCMVVADDDDDEGEESKKPSSEERLEKLVHLGSGVHEIKKDNKGQIQSCLVVGQARISTVLGKAKGLELARKKANLDCSAQFVKWLKEEVTAYDSSDDETVILMEGTEGAEEDTLVEGAKSIEKSSSKMESISKGFIRGMQMIHKGVKGGDEKTYTVIKGWSLKNSEAAKVVSASSADDEVDESESNKTSGKKGKKSSKGGDKAIDDDSATSDDADEFLK